MTLDQVTLTFPLAVEPENDVVGSVRQFVRPSDMKAGPIMKIGTDPLPPFQIEEGMPCQLHDEEKSEKDSQDQEGQLHGCLFP